MSWTPLGSMGLPNAGLGESGRAPCAGRCTALVIDPKDPDNTIYAGFACGGVWRTTDAGLNWQPLTDDSACFAIGALALDETKGRLYIGSGEDNTRDTHPGLGLFIRDPAQPKLSQVSAAGKQSLFDDCIGRIVIDPLARSHLFVSSTAGLLESTDSGASLARVNVPEANASAWVCDVALDASDPKTPRLYVAFADPLSIGGAGTVGVLVRIGTGKFTLIPHTSPPSGVIGRVALTLGPAGSSPRTVYAAFARNDDTLAGVYRLDAGSAAWELRGVPTTGATQTLFNLALAVDPNDEDVVLCGEGRLWRSTNGGASWDQVKGVHVDQHALAFHPTSSAKVWAGNDGGVWFSNDGGRTFTHRNRGLATMQYYSVSQHPVYEDVLLAGAQDNGTQRSVGSTAWDQVMVGDGFATAISEGGPWYTGSILSEDNHAGAVFRSNESGAASSWKKVTSEAQLSAYVGQKPSYVPFILDPSGSGEVFLGTVQVLRALPGKDWEAVAFGGATFSTGTSMAQTVTALTFGAGPSRVLYVGTADGQLWELDLSFMGQRQCDVKVKLPASDPRAAELAAYTPRLARRQISAIAIPSGKPKTIWAALAVTPRWQSVVDPIPDRLFVSRDGGLTFNPLTALTKLAIENGRPAGSEWAFNPIQAIAIDPDDARQVFIGTEHGVFRTRDDGDTWERWSDGLPNTQVSQLVIHRGAGLVRVATFGRGAWERRMDEADGAAATGIDLYLRSNAADGGRRRDRKATFDPLAPSEELAWTEGADITIDSHSWPWGLGGYQDAVSTVDFSKDGAPDFLAVERYETAHPRYWATSRIYVQAHNRGPAIAENVKVRAFWAGKIDDKFPDLPDDPFNTPDVDPSVDGKWHPLGAAVELPVVRPGEPAVARWKWSPTVKTSLSIGLLAIITNEKDPFKPATKVVADLVPKDKHVTLKKTSVRLPTATYLAITGLFVVAGLITAYELERKKS